MSRPGAVWVLDTGRLGEFNQVLAVAGSLDIAFEALRLTPDGALPALLPAGEPPRLIISFGRAAGAALRLRQRLGPGPRLVHLGTPGQHPATAFDLIVPMPQDDFPNLPNVLFLRLPLNGARLQTQGRPARQGGDGTVLLIGGPSRHFLMPRRAIAALVRFGSRLAAANGEALRIVTSPRTPAPVLGWLRERAARQDYDLRIYGSGAAPLARYLERGARFVVTGDSASMLADAWRTGAPVWLFPLPRRANPMTFLQHASDRLFGAGFRHGMVRRGWVGGGTDFRRWHRSLERLGYVRIANESQDEGLRWAPAGAILDDELFSCRARILGLLGGTDRDDGTHQDLRGLRPE